MAFPSTPLSVPDHNMVAGAERRRPRRISRRRQDLSLSATSTPAYSGRLLTPPWIANSMESPPYKPCESDNTSLSMKRRHGSQHHRRRRLNRACVSSGDMDEAPRLKSWRAVLHGSPTRCKSAPNLTVLCMAKSGEHICKGREESRDAGPTSPKTAEMLAERRDSLPQRARRWTVPTKAHTTRSLTSTTSRGEIIPSKDVAQEDTPHTRAPSADRGPDVALATPAMITLQRATSGRSRQPSVERETYTSFPRPVFRKGSPSFLGSVWNFNGDTRIRPPTFLVSEMSRGNVGSSPTSRRVSVAGRSIVPSMSTTAAPVRTEVSLDSYSNLGPDSTDRPFAPRRCSTKYIAGNDVLQVIWDENADTSSSASDSNAATATNSRKATALATERTMDYAGRRSSMALDMLETQMFKAIQQSRETSLAAQRKSSRPTATPPFMGEPAGPMSSTFPRSEQCSTADTTLHIPIGTLVQAMSPDEQVHFFPPLPNRVATKNDQTPVDLDLYTAESVAWSDDALSSAVPHHVPSLDAPPPQPSSFWGTPQRNRYGSIDLSSRRGTMIGTSTHQRKTSVPNGKSGRARGFPADCEHLPLLGHPAFREAGIDVWGGE